MFLGTFRDFSFGKMKYVIERRLNEKEVYFKEKLSHNNSFHSENF